jgi:hypothetical protein
MTNDFWTDLVRFVVGLLSGDVDAAGWSHRFTTRRHLTPHRLSGQLIDWYNK